jgi:hypothetical protein
MRCSAIKITHPVYMTKRHNCYIRMIACHVNVYSMSWVVFVFTLFIFCIYADQNMDVKLCLMLATSSDVMLQTFALICNVSELNPYFYFWIFIVVDSVNSVWWILFLVVSLCTQSSSEINVVVGIAITYCITQFIKFGVKYYTIKEQKCQISSFS